MTQPKVYSIPPNRRFLDGLAQGLWHKVGYDLTTLSQSIILLPTRRSARSLEESFSELFLGKATLLPDIRALDDSTEEESLEEFWEDGVVGEGLSIKQAISPLRRRLLLTQLVERYLGETKGKTTDERDARAAYANAVGLAIELALILDRMQAENIQFDRFDSLVPDAQAMHWQVTLEFLKLLTQHWPGILASEGVVDPVTRRNDRLNAMAKRWGSSRTDQHIVIAGSTGSLPATAALMKIVASLKNGAVVLPGLDRRQDDCFQEAVQKDVTHPQHTMHSLLVKLNIKPSDVEDWMAKELRESKLEAPKGRIDLISEALLPSAITNRWSSYKKKSLPCHELENLHVIECKDLRAEAEVIALLFRETIEKEAATAALITSDRTLARRVKSAATRWDLDIDDSAGAPLINSNVIVFWRLVAEMVASGLAPIPLLAVLKHPLATGGLQHGQLKGHVSQLELRFLRGKNPGSGIDDLLNFLKAEKSGDDSSSKAAYAKQIPAVRLYQWFLELAPSIKLLEEAFKSSSISFQDLLSAHNSLVEQLTSASKELEQTDLWGDDLGRKAAIVLADLYAASHDFPKINGRDYLAFFDSLLSDIVVRPRYKRKPRLVILGPLESRLLHFDRIILGGLNEGSWPLETRPDPWLGRKMREELGLSDIDLRIGQSAHDFSQAFGAKEVFLTRSIGSNGGVQKPSRWLLRLFTVLRAFDQETLVRKTGVVWTKWQGLLDAPKKDLRIKPPEPRPSLEKRPRSFSVTQIGTWLRNPYEIYARKVLKLKVLDPIHPNPEAADRGIFIHRALEAFITSDIPNNKEAALSLLLEKGRQAFDVALEHPGVWAFWWPRFVRIAEWFVEQEFENFGSIVASYAEVRGNIKFQLDKGFVEIRAVADRINKTANAEWVIIDYKTGAIPTIREIELGVMPQLPLEALILKRGGFLGLPAGSCSELSYFHLTGGSPAGRVRLIEKDLVVLVDEVEQGLTSLITAFDDAETPYLCLSDLDARSFYDDYEHLARIREWS